MKDSIVVTALRTRGLVALALTALVSACGQTDGGAVASTDTARFIGTDTAAVPQLIGYPPLPATTSGPGADTTTPTPDAPPPDPSLSPELLSLEPTSGLASGGGVVSLHGARFTAGTEVYFGDVKAADHFPVSSEWLNVTTPLHDVGTVDVRVVNPDGKTAVMKAAFRFFDTVEVSAITPNEGPALGGAEVSIGGHGFTPDSVVLFGDRAAPIVAFESSLKLHCRTPPGARGLVDVRVVVAGQPAATLPKGYRYVAAPRIKKVWPIHGPTVGGTVVEVSGSGFPTSTSDLKAAVGGKTATVASVDAQGTLLTLVTPGGAAGPVDIVIASADGSAVAEKAFAYVAPMPGLAVRHVAPPSGSASGGAMVSVVVSGLAAGVATSVLFDDVASTSVSPTVDASVLTVLVPPGAEGAADVTVVQGGSKATLAGGYTYLAAFEVTQVAPTTVPTAGGVSVTVTGAGLGAPGLTLTAGGLPVTALSASASGATFTAPACSPGPIDLVLSTADRTLVVPQAYTCVPPAPVVWALDPDSGSQSGGALVRLIGAGLPATLVARFTQGETTTEATDVVRASETTAWLRVPRGNAGAADVAVTLGGASSSLGGAFQYVDPADKKRAVYGGPIERTVNVSIFRGDDGKRLPGAVVVLNGGVMPEAHRCTTDDRGQCVISAHDVFGAQQVSVSKPGFSAFTIAGTNGRNLTMFIREQAPPGFDGPPGTPGAPNFVDTNDLTGTIAGHVAGLGKYAIPPPPTCAMAGSPDGVQCTSCTTASGCPAGLACLPMKDGGSYCLKACVADADCATGFGCANVGDGPKCIPVPGPTSATCGVSTTNFFGYAPTPGPDATTKAGSSAFALQSRIGDVTVYCIASYVQPTTGQLIPVAMGLTPHVHVPLYGTITDVEVVLDIPLDRTLRARVFDTPKGLSPTSPASAPTFQAGIDLGAEGWLPMNATPTTKEGDVVHFAGYPSTLAPFGKDAYLTFYATVNTSLTTPQASLYPSANFLIDELRAVDGEPLLTINDAGVAPPGSGMLGDLHALWGSASDDVFAVGPHGRLVHKGKLGWSVQSKFTDQDLYGLWGSGAADVVAVGANHTILRFNGVTWTPEAVVGAPPSTLRAVWGDVAVGDGGLVRRNGGTWTAVSLVHSKGLRGVHVSAEGVVVAVGETGKIVIDRGQGFVAKQVVEPTVTLNAVRVVGNDIVAVGTRGVVAFGSVDGSQPWRVEQVLPRDLLAIVAAPEGGWLVGGSAGTVLRRTPAGEWLDLGAGHGLALDVRSLWLDGAQSFLGAGSYALPVGPWMQFVLPENPRANAAMDPTHFAWSHADGGATANFVQVSLSSSDGFPMWGAVIDGRKNRVDLPAFETLIDHSPLTAGQKYFNLTRADGPWFSIDEYRFKHLGFWYRRTWSTVYGSFY